MKRIIFLLAGLTMMATSAFADNDKPITVEQLPTAAKQFIQNYFPNTKVSSAKMETEMSGKNYEVVFADGSKVEFDGKGEWKDVECKSSQVPGGIVPQKIKDYVSANYKDAKIVEIDRDKRNYEIKLNSGLELKFDSKFNLIKTDH